MSDRGSGMLCERHGLKTVVTDTDGRATRIRRRRACSEGCRFSTFEAVAEVVGGRVIYEGPSDKRTIARRAEAVLLALANLKEALGEM